MPSYLSALLAVAIVLLAACSSLPERDRTKSVLVLPLVSANESFSGWGGRYELELTEYSLSMNDWQKLAEPIIVDLNADSYQLITSIPPGRYIITGITRQVDPHLRSTGERQSSFVTSTPFVLRKGEVTVLGQELFISQSQKSAVIYAEFAFRPLRPYRLQEIEDSLELRQQNDWDYEPAH
ncbi:MAG: hypothetical protein CME36_02795 [unclassified Hahellaceae]|nr:hypothetical protein [Hahellaceae bacterium]|tara:strand:- start:23014 stop:23556 length:543 start_codon:yes stop_codon:yes gene_type:complete